MIIGREKEIQQLREAYNDEYSQFVVVYGRRRVGKTFLVRETFGYKFTFQHTGIANASKGKQLCSCLGALLERVCLSPQRRAVGGMFTLHECELFTATEQKNAKFVYWH